MLEEVFAIKVDPFSNARGVLKEGKCPDVIIVTGWWERNIIPISHHQRPGVIFIVALVISRLCAILAHRLT